MSYPRFEGDPIDIAVTTSSGATLLWPKSARGGYGAGIVLMNSGAEDAWFALNQDADEAVTVPGGANPGFLLMGRSFVGPIEVGPATHIHLITAAGSTDVQAWIVAPEVI